MHLIFHTTFYFIFRQIFCDQYVNNLFTIISISTHYFTMIENSFFFEYDPRYLLSLNNLATNIFILHSDGANIIRFVTF